MRTEAEFNEGIITDSITIDIHLGQGFITEIEALDKKKLLRVVPLWNAKCKSL